MFDWNLGEGSEIISCIPLIARAAIHSSPSTCHIKDQVQREVSLRAFNETERTKIIGYGFWGLGEDDDGDGDVDTGDVEILIITIKIHITQIASM